MPDLSSIVAHQRQYYDSGSTRDISFRRQRLLELKAAVAVREDKILAALKADLGKSAYEGYASEIGIVLKDIRFTLKYLRSWTNPRKVRTPLICFPSTSVVYAEPYGVVLIISPWNYPFQLSLAPLVAAMAAGNGCVLKPSEFAPETAAVISEMIAETFAEEYITAVEGDAETSQALLDQKFDYIFFTGSTAVGRKVMAAAAGHLTPVTLELGGKSPCIVDRDVEPQTTARRIVAGKYLNAGQTCIAPDYLLVHSRIKPVLVAHLQQQIVEFFGQNPQKSKDYPRIINRRHFDRLQGLLKDSHIVFGGNADAQDLYISPTLVENVSWEDPVMQAEIFGPILPIIGYESLSDVIARINSLPSPLALYLFSNKDQVQKRIFNAVPFGGGCINDTLLQYVSPYLPFGGVGDSGIGSYHGQAGFETFSHKKSVLKRKLRFDFPIRYPPYGSLKLLKKILR
jgi:aldehyde dehydrogenase (NAD+)